jgi:hypothetical protein
LGILHLLVLHGYTPVDTQRGFGENFGTHLMLVHTYMSDEVPRLCLGIHIQFCDAIFDQKKVQELA